MPTRLARQGDWPLRLAGPPEWPTGLAKTLAPCDPQPMDLDDIRRLLPDTKADYDEKKARADQAREDTYALVRAAAAGAMPQTEIVRLSGYTRETIRKIVDGGKK